MSTRDVLDLIDDWFLDNCPTFYKWFSNVYYFLKNLPLIIKENISLLLYFNKHHCYFCWDYDYLYQLIVWKLNRIKINMKDCYTAGVGEDRTFISDEVDEALEALENFYNPEKVLGEEPEEDKRSDYYHDMYKLEEESWEKFHKVLWQKARNWWD